MTSRANVPTERTIVRFICRGVDVDASVALFDKDHRNVDLVWYKKLQSICGSVSHAGDNLTGVGDGDHEVITVRLKEIPLHVHYILFAVCIFSSGVSFRNVTHVSPSQTCAMLFFV